jgi:ribosomal protein S18 acetylase RimI-like enzyme
MILKRDGFQEWLPKIQELNRVCFPGVRASDEKLALLVHSALGATFITRTSLDELVGFAVCEQFTFDAPRLVIIAVDPKWQRQARGGRLLEEVIDYYEDAGCRSLTLTVNSKNVRAIKMYENAGFRHVALAKRYFLKDGDGILMRREYE